MASSVHAYNYLPETTIFPGIEEQIGDFVTGQLCDLTVTIPMRNAQMNFSCRTDPRTNEENCNKLYRFLHRVLLSGDKLHQQVWFSIPEELVKALQVVSIHHIQKIDKKHNREKKIYFEHIDIFSGHRRKIDSFHLNSELYVSSFSNN